MKLITDLKSRIVKLEKWQIAIICIVAVVAIAGVYMILTSTRTLTVRAIHSSTGGNLDGVTVTVTGVTVSMDNRTATTGTDGLAVFHLPPGTYTVSLEKVGFQSKAFTLGLDGDNSITLDLVAE
jgi:hypothetical protein